MPVQPSLRGDELVQNRNILRTQYAVTAIPISEQIRQLALVTK